MERCARCDISENEVRLFDAIYEGRMSCLCERCSIIENIPIIKKPNIEQLKESENGVEVNQRMKTLAGIKEIKDEETFFKEDELNELEENPQRERPEVEQLRLVEHYYWEIMRNRRKKGLTQKKLAELLGESEVAIQLIEKNKLPENAENLIKKLEQLFQIKLRKVTEMEKYLKSKEEEPILLDEGGVELEIIPEPEPVIIETPVEEEVNSIDSFEQSRELERLKNQPEEEPENLFETKYYPIVKNKVEEEINELPEKLISPEQKNYSSSPNPIESKEFRDRDFDIKKVDLNKVTINQMQNIHRRKVEATRQERLEEQRKIEERQRILEARREQDRIKQEQKKQQEKLEKQKSEEHRNRLIQERKREFEMTRRKETEEIDQYLGGSELLDKNIRRESVEDKDSVKEFDKELI